MTSHEFIDQAALELAATCRDRYDFSSEEYFKLFADITWKCAEALSARRDEAIAKRPVVVPAAPRPEAMTSAEPVVSITPDKATATKKVKGPKEAAE